MSIASKITRLFDFVAGTRIKSADVDAELNQLVTQHNNLVDDVNAETGTAGIANGAVTTPKIATGAVTADKLDPALLTQGVDLNMHRLASTIDHPDGSVTPAKLSFDPATQTELDGRINDSLLTTNSGNAYTTIGSVTGTVVPIKFNADSTGAVTINGKPLLLPGGAAATEVKAGTLYNLTTDGTSFFMGSAGLTNFFGDGSDGAFNPATILEAATAPNGGVVANLWDMNAGTVFTTGSLTSASDCEILRIDFGVPVYLSSADVEAIRLWQVSISTGADRTLGFAYSDDGTTWTGGTTVTVSPTPVVRAFARITTAHRHWKLYLAAGGSTCTLSCQGITVNNMAGDTQTTKAWNIIYPSALNGPAVVKQFSSLTLPVGYSMTVENPCQGLVIYCQGNAVINGTIDMSKKAGLAPNGNIIPMPITKKAKCYDPNTVLLLHMDGANGSTIFTDSSPVPKTVTAVGNAQISTAQSVFGGASGYFDGSGDYLTIPDSEDWNFGTGDFEIDLRLRFASLPATSGTAGLVSQVQDANYAWGLYVYNDAGTMRTYLAVASGGTATVFMYSGASGYVVNTWYHIALVRNGNNWRIYKDGTLLIEATDVDPVPNMAAPLEIGKYFYGMFNGYVNGYIDELRVSKGSARWTGNFPVPTEAYSATSGEPKTVEKYLQLTTVLQALRGGYGGNGGYGGGSGGSYRSVGGGGGAGRINHGGFGGGGGGGGAWTQAGGNGGDIIWADMPGEGPPAIGMYTISFGGTYNGRHGAGGAGKVYNSNTTFSSTAGAGGTCLGGGGGGSGGAAMGPSASASSSAGGAGEYAGGLIEIICGGIISGGGSIIANGGIGGAGSAGNNQSGANTVGGGGGGGGSGGGTIVELYAAGNTFSGTRSVNGGAGGSAGAAGTYGGEAGGTGSSGGLGTIHLQQVA